MNFVETFWNRVSMRIAINYFRNYLHLRCLTGFWIRLWSAYNNSEIRRRFLTISQSISISIFTSNLYPIFNNQKTTCVFLFMNYFEIPLYTAIYLFIYLFFFGGGLFKFISQSTSCYCEHFKRNLKQCTRSFQQGVSTFFLLYWILSDKYMHGLIMIIHNLAGILYKFSYLSILKLRKSIQLNTSFDFSSTKLN